MVKDLLFYILYSSLFFNGIYSRNFNNEINEIDEKINSLENNLYMIAPTN
jgi:hypothetical protein